jgi:hypothetical protein
MKLFATNNQVEAEGGEPQPKRSMKDIFVGNYNYKFLCMVRLCAAVALNRYYSECFV